jgi:N-acetyl-anhydromuramoyl-L-alanine amidase
MKLQSNGWVSGVVHIASPNHDDRPAHSAVELIVIHNISLPPDEFGGAGIAQFFTNTLDCDAHPYYQRLKDVQVSAHFLIRRDGQIIQFVSCQQRAWHAGVSSWKNRPRCNDFSLGIELEGSDSVPFEDAQYDALRRLTRCLQRGYKIRALTGHSDIAPDRKTDPGPHFDWARYRAAL